MTQEAPTRNSKSAARHRGFVTYLCATAAADLETLVNKQYPTVAIDTVDLLQDDAFWEAARTFYSSCFTILGKTHPNLQAEIEAYWEAQEARLRARLLEDRGKPHLTVVKGDANA